MLNTLRSVRRGISNRMKYRILQVLNQNWNSVLQTVSGMAYFLAVTVMITSTFALIKLVSDKGTFQFAEIFHISSTDLIIICVMHYTVRHGSEIYDGSKQCYSDFLKTKSRATEMDKKFWISCRPIFIWIGNTFILETKGFVLKLFGGIVLESVINLLLMF